MNSSMIVTDSLFKAKLSISVVGVLWRDHRDTAMLGNSRDPSLHVPGVSVNRHGGSTIRALGMVILELLSGEEPLWYMYNKETGGYRRISVTKTTKATVRFRPGNSYTVVGFRLCNCSTVEEMRGNLVRSELLQMVVAWAIRVDPGGRMMLSWLSCWWGFS